MSSELYWDNLGVDYPEKMKEAVVRNAYEIRNFLKWAKERLAHRVYSFSFKIQEFRFVPSNEDARTALKNSKQVFVDEQMKRELDYRVMDRRTLVISLHSLPKELCLFVRTNNRVKKIDLRVHRVVLTNIKPKGVIEDDEDRALDLLFEQSDSVYDQGSIGRNGEIKILERHRNDRSILLGKVPAGTEITVSFNTYVLWREYKAIESLVLRPKKHHLPLLNLLQKSYFTNWDEVVPDPQVKFHILKLGRDGTEQQQEFVKKAIATPDLAILEGPPGSGKTTTILELILQLIPKRKRVLLVASTHVAVDNVIEKLMETKVDGQNLLEKYGVVPLRVGYLDDISERVAQYHIDNFVKTEQERLLKFLGPIGSNRTNAQEILYEALCHEERGKKIIENMALESANLVCGTTIGVLQSRAIKESKESKPAFDYLILDEASKTTFQEFLVPALSAERWILSGDPKQLAPYVDQAPISENVANLPTMCGDAGREDKQVCLNIFSAIDKRSRSIFGKLVVYPDESDLPMHYQVQSNAVEKILREETRNTDLPLSIASQAPQNIIQRLNLLGSSLVLVPNSKLKMMEGFLPPTLSATRDTGLSQTFSRRRNAYRNYLERKSISQSETNRSWEEQIAWRIARLYELRELKDRQKELLLDLRLLVPHFDIENPSNIKQLDIANTLPSRNVIPRSERLLKEIRKIERIALPSVLELLQLGFGEKEVLEDEDRIPLYNGLPRGVREQRHTLLIYQHRMHPDISSFPRDKIYSSAALIDSSDMEQNRDWKCNQYENRVVWVNAIPSDADVPKRGSRHNYNIAEIRAITNHLKRFMMWARDHPSMEQGSDGFWSVAILSFYKGQENRISEAMRNIFQARGYRYFESKPDHVRAEICTVDRFQGHEADLVFVSFVNTHGRIGFLDNQNRLNVALTRAKYQMVLVGDRRTFGGQNSTDLLRDLEHLTKDGPIEF